MFNRGSSAYKSTSSMVVGTSSSASAGSGVTATNAGTSFHTSSSRHPSSSLSLGPLSLCADCGAQAPSWASINRGVLLCSDCTSVHRSLGRHISHVKSIRGGGSSHWIPEQLAMVQSLYACGANSIWEYSLLNPISSSKGSRSRKPSATDPLHPVKSDFIAAKYQQLAFVYKPAKDEPNISESELSRQLHSSVRTPNLETSLRLMSQGADPNYYHPEKNSTPLQVAARAGQSGQVELLLVYGADPGALDKMGKSACDYASQAGHESLSSRISNSQYELSDRLTYFLCQKKPDHATNQHFIIPNVDHDRNADDRKVAKRKLQGLNNAVFEELAMDVYDEVDRRETDAVWASLESGSSSKSSVIVPFLPVNPEYGTTRNQGRQKLARLSAKEFAVLVMDILKEIQRRQNEMNALWPSTKPTSPLRETLSSGPHHRVANKVGLTKSWPSKRLGAGSNAFSDDEPIYDHVASDDDYYHLPEHNDKRPQSIDNMVSSLGDKPTSVKATGNIIGVNEYKELKEQLHSSEVKVQKLIESNDDMRGEIARLSATVQKLIAENEELKSSLTPVHRGQQHSDRFLVRGGEAGNCNTLPFPDSNVAASSGASSLPTPATRYMTLPPQYLANRGTGNSDENNGESGQGQQSNQSFFFDSPNSSNNATKHNSSLPFTLPNQRTGSSSSEVVTLPSQEEVVRRTEAITRCIQELLISAKDEKFHAFIPCSERIVRAVTDMVVLFPDEPSDTAVSESLSSLTAAAAHFESECRLLIVRSQTEPLNQSFVTQQVIQCAFDIAKATKQLVALFQ